MVREEMGKIKILGKPIVNISTLESGIKIIWCDRTINNLINRSKEIGFE